MDAKTDASQNLKLIIQGTLSLFALGGGLYILLTLPDLREWGAGFIGFVVGYWLS